MQELELACHIYGVRYPQDVLDQLKAQGVHYYDWLPNFRAPEVFANHKVTVHIPRRFYADELPGIPTIRPFETMACGIPLICTPWQDGKHLFMPGRDYLVARNSAEMKSHLRSILHDPEFAQQMAEQALATIRRHHTCRHRVDQLLQICESIGATTSTSIADPLPADEPLTYYQDAGRPTHA